MKKRFLGCQYPLVKTSRGLLAQTYGIDQIKADLLQLLLTNPGERVMLPTYGTPLRKLIFEPNDTLLEINTKQVISNAIATWEPRIVITDISVSSKPEIKNLSRDDTLENIDSIMYIKIKFVDPENIQEVEELMLS